MNRKKISIISFNHQSTRSSNNRCHTKEVVMDTTVAAEGVIGDPLESWRLRSTLSLRMQSKIISISPLITLIKDHKLLQTMVMRQRRRQSLLIQVRAMIRKASMTRA